MNAEQRELARRLAAHPRFQNVANGSDTRMLFRSAKCAESYGSSDDEIRYYESFDSYDDTIPDLTDAATGGVLLNMLGPGASAARRDRWVVRPGESGWTRAFQGITLAEACARALLAEWGEV